MDKSPLENMLEHGQDNLLLRYSLGALFFKNKAYAKAVEHLSKAIAHDGNHSASWKLYGRALGMLGRTEEAISTLTQGIEIAEKQGDIQAAKEMKVFLKRFQAQ